MGTMYVCDRCGKPFKHLKNRNHFVKRGRKANQALRLIFFMPKDSFIETEFDLCDECRASFDQWFGFDKLKELEEKVCDGDSDEDWEYEEES